MQTNKPLVSYVAGKLSNGRRSWNRAKKRAEVKGDVTPNTEEVLARAQAWSRLPAKTKQTIWLSINYTVEDLATLWGLTKHGARHRIYRARQVLKNLFSTR